MFKNNVRYFILFLMLGILFTFQVRILKNGVKYISPENLQETVKKVEKERAEVEQLKLALDHANSEVALFDNPTELEDETLLKNLQAQIRYLEKLLNYTDVEGPGIILIIDDADRELYIGEHGNNVLVHDQDISIIIDEIKEAGAEAISINGERIIYGETEVVCVGPTVRVNGEQMSAPFIIKAIGNRKHLQAAINAPETYANYLASYGLFVEVNTSVSVRINKYEGELKRDYIHYYEEGGN